MRVDHLFVSEHMHHTGVSRRLMRKLVEAGNEMESVGGIWLERWRWEWERENLDKFERTGFVPLADGYFRWFAFKRETKPRIPVKRLATQDGLMGYPFRSAGQLSEPGPKGDEFDRED